MILQAFFAAARAHKGQKDKGDRAYIFHPLRVAINSKGRDAKVVALLHDVVEDTNYDLSKLKLSKDQRQALKLLTHDKNVPYMTYIEKIKTNPLAREVKKKDLKDNMNLKRLKTVSQRDLDRVEKYKKAYEFLSRN